MIRIICDNHSPHKSKETQNYLAICLEGRFAIVFISKYGFCLNMIKGFFSNDKADAFGDKGHIKAGTFGTDIFILRGRKQGTCSLSMDL